jgi:pilus assembly protein CpaE
MRLVLATPSRASFDRFCEQLSGFDVDVTEAIGAADLVSTARQTGPDAVVVDTALDGYLDLIQQLHRHVPRVPIVALGPIAGSGSLAPLVLKAGAKELLFWEERAAATVAALHQLCREYGAWLRQVAAALGTSNGTAHADQSPPRGRLVTVVGSKGGVGSTLISVNLAAAWQREGLESPVLVDLRLPFGGLPIALNADLKGRGTLETLIPVVEEAERRSIEQQLVAGAEGMRLLALPADPAVTEQITGDQVAIVLERLRREFPCVVADVGLLPSGVFTAAARQSDCVLVVASPDVAGVSGARRVAQLLRHRVGLEVGRGVHVVINRMESDAPLTAKQIATQFPVPPLAFVRRADRTAREAERSGGPIRANHKEALSADLRALAAAVLDVMDGVPDARVYA